MRVTMAVAELPTCQFTFGGQVAPKLLVRTIVEHPAITAVRTPWTTVAGGCPS